MQSGESSKIKRLSQKWLQQEKVMLGCCYLNVIFKRIPVEDSWFLARTGFP